MKEPYVTNCFIKARPQEDGSTPTLFYQNQSEIRPYLDGYAIIPKEDYKELETKNAELVEQLEAKNNALSLANNLKMKNFELAEKLIKENKALTSEDS